VRATDVEPPPDVHVWNYHLLISSIGAFVFLCSALIGSYFVAQNFDFDALLLTRDRILESEKFHDVSVFSGTQWESDGQFEFVRITAISNQDPGTGGELAKEIAAAALESDPTIHDKAMLAITVAYGFDIGIANSWRSANFNRTPQEWSEILGRTGIEPRAIK